MFFYFYNLLMVYTRKHPLYQLTNPLQFPHETPVYSIAQCIALEVPKKTHFVASNTPANRA